MLKQFYLLEYKGGVSSQNFLYINNAPGLNFRQFLTSLYHLCTHMYRPCVLMRILKLDAKQLWVQNCICHLTAWGNSLVFTLSWSVKEIYLLRLSEDKMPGEDSTYNCVFYCINSQKVLATGLESKRAFDPTMSAGWHAKPERRLFYFILNSKIKTQKKNHHGRLRPFDSVLIKWCLFFKKDFQPWENIRDGLVPNPHSPHEEVRSRETSCLLSAPLSCWWQNWDWSPQIRPENILVSVFFPNMVSSLKDCILHWEHFRCPWSALASLHNLIFYWRGSLSLPPHPWFSLSLTYILIPPCPCFLYRELFFCSFPCLLHHFNLSLFLNATSP